MQRNLWGSCVLLSVVACAWGYGSGAPKEVCEDMLPKHHVDAQTSDFPYSVKIDKKVITSKDKVILTISAPSNEEFKGFLVEGRVGKTPVGKFSPGPGHKLVDCPPGKSNAATHINANGKKSVQLEWSAPPKLAGTVQFYTTVAKNGGEFWVKQATGTVTVKKA